MNTISSGQLTIDSGQLTVDNGQLTVDNGQLLYSITAQLTVNCQLSTVN